MTGSDMGVATHTLQPGKLVDPRTRNWRLAFELGHVKCYLCKAEWSGWAEYRLRLNFLYPPYGMRSYRFKWNHIEKRAAGGTDLQKFERHYPKDYQQVMYCLLRYKPPEHLWGR